jgi:hypothetical protein
MQSRDGGVWERFVTSMNSVGVLPIISCWRPSAAIKPVNSINPINLFNSMTTANKTIPTISTIKTKLMNSTNSINSTDTIASNRKTSQLSARMPYSGGRAGLSAHLASALITGIPLLVSFLVPMEYLPPFKCIFLNITGLPGPFCGITRSIWAISQGNWAYATINYPLAWVVYIGLFFLFTRSVGRLLIRTKRTSKSRSRPVAYRTHWMAWMVGILILSNWVYRLLMGLR